jgi:hypothetical protein
MFGWLRRRKNPPTAFPVLLGVAVGRDMKDVEPQEGFLAAPACMCDDPNCPDAGVIIEFAILIKQISLPFAPQLGMVLMGYGEDDLSRQQVIGVTWNGQCFMVKLDNHFVDEDPIRSKVLLEGVLERYEKKGWRRAKDMKVVSSYK